jgi:kynureninase
LYSAIPGLEIIEEVGIANIAAESKRRTQLMVDFALERGWTLNSPTEAERRGGSVMIGVTDAPAMVEKLAARKIFVDCRPRAGLRISPHFFNTDEEVQEAMNVLAEMID